jgi:dTDP-4-dehydrorhamnose reductase
VTRYLVTGAGGMLGADLALALEGRDVTLLTRADLDVSDPAAVDAAVAAYTKVDDAESDEDAATLVNGTAAGILAEAAARHGARIVQVSTDYVFDGTATTPYPEDAPRHPVSAYGRSKAIGEELVERAHPDGHYIVRTAWLYGAGGPNFAKTMLKLAADRDTIGVVVDQVGQPTWTGDLAHQIVALVDADAPAGIYHGTRFDFARAVLATQGLDPERITPTDSAAFVRPAPRPAYSVLGHDRWAAAGLAPLRDWRESLEAAAAAGALRLA